MASWALDTQAAVRFALPRRRIAHAVWHTRHAVAWIWLAAIFGCIANQAGRAGLIAPSGFAGAIAAQLASATIHIGAAANAGAVAAERAIATGYAGALVRRAHRVDAQLVGRADVQVVARIWDASTVGRAAFGARIALHAAADRVAHAGVTNLEFTVRASWANNAKARIGNAETVGIADLAGWARELTFGTRRCTFTVFAHATAAQVAFVDHAITIVVETVADFGAAGGVPNARDCTIDTAVGASAARTHAAARRAHARHVVINDAVAIVVDIVAGFGDWTNAALARQRAVDTHELARVAGAHAVTTRLASINGAVIDGAVAIVVKAVATLRAWANFASAHQRAQHADRCTK